MASNVRAGWVAVSVGEYEVRSSPKFLTRRRSESVTTEAAAGRAGPVRIEQHGPAASRPSSARVSRDSGAPKTRRAPAAGCTDTSGAAPATR